jgi:chromosome segregation ATPase
VLNHLPEEHRPDDDPTEELPVLSEALLDPGSELFLVEEEVSPEETEYLQSAAEPGREASALEQDESAFEADPHGTTVVLQETWPELESQWQEDEEAAQLRGQLEAARRENREQRESESRLVTRLAERNAQLAQLLERLHDTRQEVARLAQRLKAQEGRQAELQSVLDHTRLQLAKWRQLALAATPRPEALSIVARARPPGVTGSIVNVLSWWQDMRARVTRYRARVLRLVLRGPPPNGRASAPRPTSRQ